MDNPTEENTPKNISKYIFREANLPEPTEKVSRTSGTVFWGEDNLQPQFLNRLYYENPVHGGIINQKIKLETSKSAKLKHGTGKRIEAQGCGMLNLWTMN